MTAEEKYPLLIGHSLAGRTRLRNIYEVANFICVHGQCGDLNENGQRETYVVSASNNIYNILNLSGVQILIFLAGLQSISPSIYESAKIEGATGWESFWKITFPMVKPLILLNLFYSLIDSFTNPQNGLITLIYNTGIKQGRFGIATAMAWSYTAIIAVLVVVLITFIGLFTYKQRRSEGR